MSPPSRVAVCIAFSMIFSLSLVSAQCAFKGFQKQEASAKLSCLAGAAASNKKSLNWPNALELGELFIEKMDRSFDTVSDEMPKQLLGLRTRKKLVHTVGILAKAQWVPVANSANYTGIFSSGADEVLIRFSSAASPPEDGGFPSLIPALSVKVLMGNSSSLNLFAMYSLDGQTSNNFFQHDLSNHMPDLWNGAPLPLTLLKKTFAKASPWPSKLGISPFSRVDKYGNGVVNPNSPYRLVFAPTPSLRNLTIPSTPYTQHAGIYPVGKIYDIYAVTATPYTASPSQVTKIGELNLKEPLSASRYGDKSLFFQHTRFEQDIAQHPAYGPFAKREVAGQTKQTTAVHWPDLQ